jgi:hypothetical protein
MRLWAGQAISEFGSRFTREELRLVAVISLGATAGQTGLLAAASGLPALFAIVARVWVDRIRRRPVLVATDLGRAGSCLVTNRPRRRDCQDRCGTNAARNGPKPTVTKRSRQHRHG